MPSMSRPAAIFGDIDSACWGVLVGASQPRLAIGSLEPGSQRITLRDAELDRDDDQSWSISAAGTRLRLEIASPATTTPGDKPSLQPVRVTGTATLDDGPREIDVDGLLGDAAIDGSIESLRLVGSWFPGGHQISLLAARPKTAKGHDQDAISAVATGENGAVVFDPRLSTTYGPDGAPRRAGIELWLGSEEESDQYPRRMAGVATGACVIGSAPGVELTAYALRCLSRGEAGAGVYALFRAA